MLKNILIDCAELLSRDDILDTLKTINSLEDITNKQIKYDINRLIYFYNSTLYLACEDYLDLTYSEILKSDANNKIHYYKFEFDPVRILDIRNETGRIVKANITPTYLLVSSANTAYQITYKYLPNKVCDIYEKTQLPKNLSAKVLVYGIISEFLASKNQFSQSEFWQNKFLNGLFKIKNFKGRHLKSTFER